jgi:hypothetical protein
MKVGALVMEDAKGEVVESKIVRGRDTRLRSLGKADNNITIIMDDSVELGNVYIF